VSAAFNSNQIRALVRRSLDVVRAAFNPAWRALIFENEGLRIEIAHGCALPSTGCPTLSRSTQ
jgi:hypothetical protein